MDNAIFDKAESIRSKIKKLSDLRSRLATEGGNIHRTEVTLAIPEIFEIIKDKISKLEDEFEHL